jgi:hypothetical protein
MRGTGLKSLKVWTTMLSSITLVLIFSTLVESQEVYVDLQPPYSEYSGRYPVGTTIVIPKGYNVDVVASMKTVNDAEWYRSLDYTELVRTEKESLLEYCCENFFWVFVIGLVGIMSYRFFSGRAADFQDAWDELTGKK